MDYQSQITPPAPPAAPPRDPLAVALGNASLLGVGYLMLGRRALAAGTGLATLVFVTLLVSVLPSEWFEAVVILWWAALIAHGWFLAGGGGQRVAVRRHRLVASGATVAVLLVVGLLRFDAYQIDRTVTAARQHGDCARAVRALDGVWLGDRVADAPLAARGDQTSQACQRLQAARRELDTALSTGDTRPLMAGFDLLTSVLAQLPGHEKMVDTVLDRFLGGLPARNACHTAAVTDWLRQRRPSHDALDRSAAAAARTAPLALVGCGDDRMAADDWKQALARYQQLIDQYPRDKLVARARQGVQRARLAIELANVRSLLQGPTGTQPEYCSQPAKYSGAAPYGKGTNRARFYGNDSYTTLLPPAWWAADAADAVLVVCAGQAQFGTSVQTCPYQNKLFSGGFPEYVTFHKIAIPVQAYELRTGRLVSGSTVEIGGTSCPDTVTYTAHGLDTGPPSDMYVIASNDDVRAAFASLIIP